MRTCTPRHTRDRSIIRAQLENVSFGEILDLTAVRSVFYLIIFKKRPNHGVDGLVLDHFMGIAKKQTIETYR